jgi:hypothetical protein
LKVNLLWLIFRNFTQSLDVVPYVLEERGFAVREELEIAGFWTNSKELLLQE